MSLRGSRATSAFSTHCSLWVGISIAPHVTSVCTHLPGFASPMGIVHAPSPAPCRSHRGGEVLLAVPTAPVWGLLGPRGALGHGGSTQCCIQTAQGCFQPIHVQSLQKCSAPGTCAGTAPQPSSATDTSSGLPWSQTEDEELNCRTGTINSNPYFTNCSSACVASSRLGQAAAACGMGPHTADQPLLLQLLAQDQGSSTLVWVRPREQLTWKEPGGSSPAVPVAGVMGTMVTAGAIPPL